MNEYEFTIELAFRKMVCVEALNAKDAYAKVEDEFHDCDLNDGGGWWFHWGGLYDEQQRLLDETLV